MGLYEYNQLSLDEKANVLWQHGNFLISRKEGENGFNLYSLFDFYVEVQASNSTNKIENIITFKTKRLLEPYLNNIKLDL
jgi:hypothetical protein